VAFWRRASMFEQRNIKLDVFALALLVLTLFAGAALVSYDPADPPTTLVYPANAHVENACGRCGALVAAGLFNLLGVGAYYLVGSLAIVDALLLARRRISDPSLRAVGWGVSLLGLTTLVAMVAPWLSPGPIIGAGGYLGATGRGLLQLHFATAGAYLIAVSLILGGLLLCSDYVLLRLAAWGLGLSATAVGQAARVLPGSKSRLADEEVEEEEEYEYEVDEEEGEADEGSPLRITKPATASDPETNDAGNETTQSDKPAPGVAARLSSALRIGRRKSEREAVMEELDGADHVKTDDDYELPSVDLLLESEPFAFEEHEKDVRRKARLLEKTFTSFGFNVRVVEVQTGPVIAQFEVELEAGLRLSRITALADDLAIALRVPTVRIVAPIPGKNTVGIEIPNKQRQLVRLREVMEEGQANARKMGIPIYLGKDVAGSPMVVDLTTLPHLLIAGRTGTGKSVCLNTIIASMLMTRRPDEVRMLMIDPKMVELSPYKKLPHLMHPVVTDMKKAEAILAWAVDKMEERYSLLAKAGVRHVSSYNQLGRDELLERLEIDDEDEQDKVPLHLPYIVIVADEMADLMMTAGKEVEQHIIRLAQKSRAVGIHLVLATQKPTVDVITGLIKSNLPARIAFQVASRVDSRVVLDEMGADKLLGNGDLLFLWPGTSTLLRGQGTYLSDDEINRVVDVVSTNEPQYVKELVALKPVGAGGGAGGAWKKRDELYESAIEVVVREGRGSVSLLQRSLGIGYGRAARLIDYMEEDGFVGPYAGSQAREVLLTASRWMELQGEEPAEVQSPPPAKKRTVKVRPPDDEEEEAPLDEEEEAVDDADEEIADDDDQAEYEEDDEAEYEEEDEADEEEECEAEEYEEDEYEEEDEEEIIPPPKSPRIRRARSA